MPHIILEYSENIKENIDFKKLFRKVHSVLSTRGEVKIDNCKSRSICRTSFYIGDGSVKHAFLHLSIQWLEGRSVELKTEIGEKLLELLKSNYSKSLKELELQITVHINDMQRVNYFKHPKGTLSTLQIL
jgi:5-carboxymethyl-2-hydroxymuconate isomerase